MLPQVAGAQLGPADVQQILADASNPQSPYAYYRLHERFEADDSLLSNTDVLRLYLGYTTQPDYTPEATGDLPLYELYQQGKFKQVADGAQQLLRRNPVSLAGHLLLSLSSDKLAQNELAHKHQLRYIRLLRAVYTSGTGRTMETAVHTTSTSDTYRVLNEMEMRPQGQRLYRDEATNQTYNIMRSQGAGDREAREVFFNVSLAYASGFDDSELERLTDNDEDDNATSDSLKAAPARPRTPNRRN